MKNYMEKRNDENKGWGLNFWEDPFEQFFKPFSYGEKRGSMRTDIKETDKEYELAVDMPGFDKKDISVTLKDGYLTVEAKRDEKEENGKNYLRRERSFSCSRSYYVGDNVTEDDVRAKYDNGVLVLSVPKKQEKEIRTGNIAID